MAKLGIGGMACSSCSAAVEGALLRVPGVLSAVVALTLEQAEVQYGEGACTPANLVAAVEAAGFEAAGALAAPLPATATAVLLAGGRAGCAEGPEPCGSTTSVH